MIDAQAIAERGVLPEDTVWETLAQGLTEECVGQKVLALIPDHMHSMPLPLLFRLLVDILHDAKQIDFMVALGTHPALSEESLHKLVGITTEERNTTYKQAYRFAES